MLERKNYLSKGKWEGTCLLNQTWGRETDTWWKVGTWKFADKIWRYLIFIILFSLIFRSSLSSSKLGDSSLRFVSVFLLSSPTCWNFEISMTLYIPTPPQFSIHQEYRWAFCLFFFLGSFVGFFSISNFVFTR